MQKKKKLIPLNQKPIPKEDHLLELHGQQQVNFHHKKENLLMIFMCTKKFLNEMLYLKELNYKNKI